MKNNWKRDIRYTSALEANNIAGRGKVYLMALFFNEDPCHDIVGLLVTHHESVIDESHAVYLNASTLSSRWGIPIMVQEI